jgi:pyruvate dehydrogenase E2 component (dihydrolipoamide acetyltransferase)
MQASLAEQPQVTLMREVDASVLVAVRIASLPSPAPSIQAFIVQALARAVTSHSTFNAVIDKDELVTFDDVNVGVAIDLGDGLVVPVVRAAQSLSRSQIDHEIARLSDLAMRKELSMPDVSDATITVSNLGGMGIDFFTPILSPPQVAILGIGRLRAEADRPPTIGLSLTFDHRANDGASAAGLLMSIARQLSAIDHS